MDTIWSAKVDPILNVGYPLSDVGIRNWGLTRTQALAALDHLAAEKIAVLGGDVYEADGTMIQPAYDNWYCDRLPDETTDAFTERSISQARAYITKYTATTQRDILFSLVPDV